MPAARRDGSHAAAAEAAITSSSPIPNATQSNEPNIFISSCDATSRSKPRAAVAADSSAHECESQRLPQDQRSDRARSGAPSATRMPISLVRCVTTYDNDSVDARKRQQQRQSPKRRGDPVQRAEGIELRGQNFIHRMNLIDGSGNGCRKHRVEPSPGSLRITPDANKQNVACTQRGRWEIDAGLIQCRRRPSHSPHHAQSQPRARKRMPAVPPWDPPGCAAVADSAGYAATVPPRRGPAIAATAVAWLTIATAAP